MTSPSLPFACEDLPPVEGRLGPEPEDFQVDEIPLHAPAGEGHHWLVKLRKRGMTTPDAIRAVGKAAGIKDRDIGSAGMKDRHAVTTQWISVPTTARAPDSWELSDALEVLEVVGHDRKVRTGQLRGNRFRVRLVDIHEDARARALAIAARLTEQGLPNYFGEQRFGRGGDNLATALAWLDGGGVSRGPKARLHRKLYPSVVQAEIFNRYLAARAGLGLERPLAGDVVRLDGNRSCFLVEDVDAEAPRLRSGDIHLTGPMPGPKMKAETGVPGELRAAAEEAAGLTVERRAVLDKLVDGTRRDLLLRPADLEIEEDSAAERTLTLSFALPPGAYATQLLREFLRTDRVR